MWTAPDVRKRNGILAMYEVVVYQELSDSKVEKITSSSMSANTTIWKVDNLSPLTDYIFHIKAGTVEGFGPAVIVHKRSDGRLTLYFTNESKWMVTVNKINELCGQYSCRIILQLDKWRKRRFSRLRPVGGFWSQTWRSNEHFWIAFGRNSPGMDENQLSVAY